MPTDERKSAGQIAYENGDQPLYVDWSLLPEYAQKLWEDYAAAKAARLAKGKRDG